MATADYPQIVKHWPDWKLFHATGNRYEIFRYDHHNQEAYKATIDADDDKAAIIYCRAIIRIINQKKGS